jgi:bifunctional non-homologous end joining protein LigD
MLQPLARQASPFGDTGPRGREDHWVEPRLVCEVRFTEWTADGGLRHPIFLGMRTDKKPEDVRREGEAELDAGPASEADGVAADGEVIAEAAPRGPAARARAAVPREVRLSNLKKVFWPDEGYTKGDLIAYYDAIAPYMLPYLRDRPIVLTRYPDGIDGKSFFQKDAPRGRPTWLRTVTVHSEDTDRDLELALLDDAEALAWVANLGTIPIHVVASRAGDMERPDWLVVDLDPKDAPFAHVVRLALAVRALCDAIGLPCFAKTSGQRGLHVLSPTGGQLTHEQARALTVLLCREIEARHPDLATTARALTARGGRVYLDALQNGRGKTIAAPYCVRPRDGAPVSTPLRWGEVNARLDPARFTLRNAVRRVARLGEDPLRPVLEDRPDLLGVLGRLHALVGKPDEAAPSRARR